jgi:hypothetical protein
VPPCELLRRRSSALGAFARIGRDFQNRGLKPGAGPRIEAQSRINFCVSASLTPKLQTKNSGTVFFRCSRELELPSAMEG